MALQLTSQNKMRQRSAPLYIMQHELEVEKDKEDPKTCEIDCKQSAADGRPQHVLFNDKEGALIEKPCVMRQDETLRIYFGNAGPYLGIARVVLSTHPHEMVSKQLSSQQEELRS
jgi:hypothetical protein